MHEPIVCGWENHRMICVFCFRTRIHRSFCFSLLIPTIYICASSFSMIITLSGKILLLFYYYNHRRKKSRLIKTKKQKSNQISPYEWWKQTKSKLFSYFMTLWQFPFVHVKMYNLNVKKHFLWWYFTSTISTQLNGSNYNGNIIYIAHVMIFNSNDVISVFFYLFPYGNMVCIGS